MVRRLNPWPAFTDLFSCLLIGTFAGLMLKGGAESREAAIYAELGNLAKQLEESLKSSELKPRVRKREECGNANEVCLDLDIRFELNKHTVSEEYVTELQEACKTMGPLWRDFKGGDQWKLELVIEGHSDDLVPEHSPDDVRFRYNWDLSSQRAISVLAALDGCGVGRVAGHRVSAVGRADTEPLPCDGRTVDECRELRRHTTFKFRVNKNVRPTPTPVLRSIR